MTTASHQSCSLGSLSDDLVWLIFELVYQNSPKSIRALVSVSRQARRVAMEFRYRDVLLRPRHIFPSLAVDEHQGTLEGISWHRCHTLVLQSMYKYTRNISIKCEMDWDLAADVLIRCKSLQSINWISSRSLSGPVPDTISCLIVAKSPGIDLHISGHHWRPGGDSSSCSMLIEPLKSLAYRDSRRHEIFSVWDFSHLQSLELESFSLYKLVASLPSSPMPALKTFKLVFWALRRRGGADSQLSYLLRNLRPLEHLDITCSDEYLDASAVARHTPLRVLKLQNHGGLSDAGRECRSFSQDSLKLIFNACPQISELALEMIQSEHIFDECITTLSTLQHLRILALRIQTRITNHDVIRVPNFDVDLHFVNELVDRITEKTQSKGLQSISIETGDFRNVQTAERQLIWDSLKAKGHIPERLFHYSKFETGWFPIQNPEETAGSDYGF